MADISGPNSRVIDVINFLAAHPTEAFTLSELTEHFSPTGSVTLELALSGMSDNLNVEEIERYAERLRAAAAIVTSETHGRIPVN